VSRCAKIVVIMPTQSDLAFLSTTELSDLMQRRELSPVELLDPACNASSSSTDGSTPFLVLAEQVAQARESEERFRTGQARPLEGLPVSIKDNVALAWARMTLSSRMGPAFEMPVDAELVARLRRAGAVFPGKTSRVRHHPLD
jgi:aspartyl-tRNA(Asn)/glutamyl-tRNA(Gln) amidotransferase subunit A